MPNPTHTPDAYLFTNEWGDKELLLSLYGEPAQRLLELGWTYSELFARTVDTELLEALKEAVAQYGKQGGPWNVSSDPGGWLNRARAAITKAEAGS